MTPEQAVAELETCVGYGSHQPFTEAVDVLSRLVPRPAPRIVDRVRIAVATGFSDDETLTTECLAIPYGKDAAWAWNCVGANDDVGRVVVEVDVPRFPVLQARAVEE